MFTKDFYRDFTLQVIISKKLTCIKFKNLLQESKTVENLYKKAIKDKLVDIINIANIKNSLAAKGISYLCVWEDDYPNYLKNITDPPIIIFYKGNVELLKSSKNFAIVGSRRMTSYGKKITSKIVPSFKDLGYSIVSGLATGIDSVVHNIALENKIPVIAVLASSADEPTPVINTELYNRILENQGLIISESLPGTQVFEGFFPRRNRIIAGLSEGVLVIEANDRSGALITARMAQVYNREVFAVPGNIDNIYSAGSNMLIKDSKAKLVQDVGDILTELSIGPSLMNTYDLSSLNEIQRAIFEYLQQEPRFVEEVVNFLKFDISVIISSCTILEMNGLIAKNERGQYYLN